MSMHSYTMPLRAHADEAASCITDEADMRSAEPAFAVADSSEPLQIYMREVGQHPLLTAQEEKELAAAMRAGKEAEAQVDAEEDADARDQLEMRIRKGKLAQERLANCNLRLVVSQAKRHVNRGLSFLDLIQEGNVGLMRAVEKFDHTRGFKFSTYATWWIRQAISRALADQSRTIRLPVHIVETIKKLDRVSKQLRNEAGRDPSLLEIALEMKILKPAYRALVPDYVIREDAYHLVEDEELSRCLQEAADQIKNLQSLDVAPISLYSPIQQDEDGYYLDLLEDISVPEPSELASHEIMKEQVEQVVCDLEERERDVLYFRYGLSNIVPQTLEALGKHFKITRERIRQIEREAMRKIGEEDEGRRLRDFLV